MEDIRQHPELAAAIQAAVEAALARRLPDVQVGSDKGNVLTPIYPPLASVPKGGRLLSARDYAVNATLTAAGTPGATATAPLNISEPSMIYAIAAAAYNVTGNTDGFLNRITMQVRSGSSELYQTEPVIMSSIVGQFGFVRLLGARGWIWNSNASIQVVLANLDTAVTQRVSVVFQAVLFRP